MKVEIIKCLRDNYSYLIIDEKNQNASLVDPSEASPIIDYIEKNRVNLKYILITHHHHDHVGGNLELKKKYNPTIFGFKGDKDRIPGIDVLIEDNDIWKKENLRPKFIIYQVILQDILLITFIKKKRSLLVTLYFHLDVEEFLREHIDRCMTH